MSEKFEDISLYQLSNLENLSTRTYNICSNASLWSLKDILEFYYQNKSFRKLRGCGELSNAELISLSKKYYLDFYNSILYKEKEKDEIGKILDNLSLKQKTILNAITKSLIDGLSVRAYNALSKYFNKNFSIKNIYNLIPDNRKFKHREIEGIGAKTTAEIESFINELYEYIQLISLFEDEQQLEYEYYKAILLKYYSSPDIDRLENFVTNNGQIQLFNLINQLFKNNLIFNERELIIFNNTFSYFENFEYKTLEEIASKINLTRERTRQIRENIYNELNPRLKFVSDLNIDFEDNYNIDTASDIISINQETINKINFEERTFYNIIFINKILSICNAKTHALVGKEKEIIFNVNKASTHNWHSTYVISKELTSMFNFEKLANDVSLRLNKRDPEYRFHFQGYLLNFYKKSKYKNIDRIAAVCEYIIYYEFDLILDEDDNIVFNKKMIKKTHKIVREVLEEAQKPLHIEDIYARIIKKYPNYEGTIGSIRSSVGRFKDFIYFGRQSTYGLSEWEKEYSKIKGGTIRDIVEEFLSNFDQPKHINDITQHVIKFRKTSLRSIYDNLRQRQEKNKRFIFFIDGYVGLKSLENSYNIKLAKFSEDYGSLRKSWEENYQLLKDFITKYGRYPKLNGDYEEKRLSRFCSNNRSLWRKGKLSHQKVELLKSISFDFTKSNSTRNWFKRLEDYKNFILNHKREPSYKFSNEKSLYNWKQRTLNDLKENKLTSKQIQLLKDIDIV